MVNRYHRSNPLNRHVGEARPVCLGNPLTSAGRCNGRPSGLAGSRLSTLALELNFAS